MKKIHELQFGWAVEDCSGNILQKNVLFEVCVSVSDLKTFIEDFEKQTCTVLLNHEIILLEPYYHQKIMDI